MKVLLDARMRAGGVGRYAADLLAGMASVADVEIEVIGPDSRRRAGPFTPWGRRMVAVAARAHGPDVVHGIHFELPRVRGSAGVVTMPDLIPLDQPASMPSGFRRAYFEWVVQTSARRARAVITHSESSAETLIAHKVPSSKIRIVPHGVHPTFRPGSEAERSEAQRRFAGGRRYVAVVADDRPHKNLAVLERLSSLMPSDVVIACRGDLKSKHGSIVEVPRLSDAELRLFYVGSEALLMPSVIEGFGLPALESAACGAVVICGAAVGAAGYLGDAAIRVDVENERSILDALMPILRDRAVADPLRSAAVGKAAGLTIRRMTEETHAVYVSVA